MPRKILPFIILIVLLAPYLIFYDYKYSKLFLNKSNQSNSAISNSSSTNIKQKPIGTVNNEIPVLKKENQSDFDLNEYSDSELLYPNFNWGKGILDDSAGGFNIIYLIDDFREVSLKGNLYKSIQYYNYEPYKKNVLNPESFQEYYLNLFSIEYACNWFYLGNIQAQGNCADGPSGSILSYSSSDGITAKVLILKYEFIYDKDSNNEFHIIGSNYWVFISDPFKIGDL